MPFDQKDFPNLHPGNHRITSPVDDHYNCIAWAIGLDSAWLEPGTNSRYLTTSLVALLQSLGFEDSDGSLEAGVEKIAIYTDGPEYMHAARQLDTGKWTSKMGPDEDIEHDTPDNLAGPAFGKVTVYMKRPRP